MQSTAAPAPCNNCQAAPAKLYCSADSARLCVPCDQLVRAARVPCPKRAEARKWAGGVLHSPDSGRWPPCRREGGTEHGAALPGRLLVLSGAKRARGAEPRGCGPAGTGAATSGCVLLRAPSRRPAGALRQRGGPAPHPHLAVRLMLVRAGAGAAPDGGGVTTVPLHRAVAFSGGARPAASAGQLHAAAAPLWCSHTRPGVGAAWGAGRVRRSPVEKAQSLGALNTGKRFLS